MSPSVPGNLEGQDLRESLTAAVRSLASEAQDGAARFSEIEAALRANVESNAAELPACLDRLHAEIERQQSGTGLLIAKLREALARSATSPAKRGGAGPKKKTDPATGLAERSCAEEAIAEAISGGRNFFLAVFVLERLDQINSRFGYRVGDQMFMMYTQAMVQQLGRGDRLFRWTGPALVGLIERSGSVLQVRGEVNRIASKRVSETIEADGRYILLSVGTHATVIALVESTPEAVAEAADAFVRGQGTA